MAAKGYCTVDEVAAFLGLTFTPEQDIHAERMIEAAEAYFDTACNRAWLVGAQTNEEHRWAEYQLGELYVRYAPVTSVTSVTARTYMGEAEQTLTADTDYEVVSLEHGLIRIVSPTLWDRVRVNYTPTDTPPVDVQHAVAELAAHRMRSNLMPNSFGLQSLGLPDLQVQFRQYAGESLPPSVSDVIARWRYRVVA